MKKGWKISLFIASIMTITGVILLFVSVCIGGVGAWKEALSKGLFSYGITYVSGVEATIEPQEQQFQEEITSITVEAEYAEVEIAYWEESYVGFVYSGSVEYGIDELGCLMIEGETSYIENSIIGFFGDKREIPQELQIFLPIDCKLDIINIELDVGKIEAEQLQANELCMTVDAADIECKDFVVDYLEIEVEVANITLEGVVQEWAEFDISMGNVAYQGEIRKNLVAMVDMGKLELDLVGAYTDHNYELSWDLGTMDIGTDTYSGAGFNKVIDHGMPHSVYELSCDMGKVEMKFTV